MATKLALPDIATFNTEGVPFGVVLFLQATRDGLNTIDRSVVYRDAINAARHTPRIRAKSATGQSFSISGAAVASGADHAALVRDFDLLLAGYIELSQQFNSLLDQLEGR